MRPEQDVPAEDRFLLALGRLAAPDAKALIDDTSKTAGMTAEVLAHCYADVALPARYDVVFRYASPIVCASADLILVRAFGDGRYPFDSLQHGWKHVGVFEINGPMPALIEALTVGPFSGDLPPTAQWVGSLPFRAFLGDP